MSPHSDWLHPTSSSTPSWSYHHHQSSNRSSSYYPDSILSSSCNTTHSSSNIDRKSSGRSNHTIDSGILVNSYKRSLPPCQPTRNLRYEEILPKKRVSILLPARAEVQKARIVRHSNDAESSHVVSTKPGIETDLITEAMHELMSVFSQHCDIIFLVFVPRPDLKALSADDIGRVLYGLYSMLKGEEINRLLYFEICVWMLQRFIFKAGLSNFSLNYFGS